MNYKALDLSNESDFNFQNLLSYDCKKAINEYICYKAFKDDMYQIGFIKNLATIQSIRQYKTYEGYLKGIEKAIVAVKKYLNEKVESGELKTFEISSEWNSYGYLYIQYTR